MRALLTIAALAALLSSAPANARLPSGAPGERRRAAGPRAPGREARRQARGPERVGQRRTESAARGDLAGERGTAERSRTGRARRGPRGSPGRRGPRRPVSGRRPPSPAPPQTACPTCVYVEGESGAEDVFFAVLGWILFLAVWTSIVLALLNWVRTRRLAVYLLCYSAVSLLLYAVGRGWSDSVSWPYPGVVVTLGLVLLLTRLWPCWRLLRRPTTARLPSRIPAPRGTLSGREWPLRTDRGLTTIAVLVSFAMVLVVAGGAVSCLVRGMQVDSYARRSLVATALLEGALARARAGAVPPDRLNIDLSERAQRLLPQGRADARVGPGPARGVQRIDLEVSWRGRGRNTHRAALSGLVYLPQEGRSR